MTAREQLLAARDRGHELTVIQRGPWPEYDDPNPKWGIVCTCGWKSRMVRSRKAANATMVWHLGKVISEDLPRSAS
jgi:hypothetical protein